MVPQESEGRDSRLAAQRLCELLDRLRAEKLTQAHVAARVQVTPQYLSDVRNGRRALSELFARRLANEFSCDHRWLLGMDHALEQPCLAVGPAPRRGQWLPVLPHPVEGNPYAHAKWDGACVELTELAAARLDRAALAYVLRFGHNDTQGRLKKGDLVLMSQSASDTAELHVVRSRKKCFLARRQNGHWVRAATGAVLPDGCVVAGHCVAILWSALS